MTEVENNTTDSCNCPHCGEDVTKYRTCPRHTVNLVTSRYYMVIGPPGTCAAMNTLAGFLARMVPDACFVVQDGDRKNCGVYGPKNDPADAVPGRYQILDRGYVISSTDDKIEAQCRATFLKTYIGVYFGIYDSRDESNIHGSIAEVVEADYVADPVRTAEIPRRREVTTYPDRVRPWPWDPKSNEPPDGGTRKRSVK